MSETASDAAAAPTPARAGADGGVLSGNAAEQMQVLRGVKVLAEACAEALVNEPTPEVLADLRKVAAALGGGLFDGIEPDGALRQRYYDRMFVTTSPHYVPLIESSVANRIEADGRVSYGAVSSSKSDHVIRCYKTAGFDYTGMRGYEIAVKSLHPDSMASELAFMAFLAEAAVEETRNVRITGGRIVRYRSSSAVQIEFANETGLVLTGFSLRILPHSAYGEPVDLGATLAEELNAVYQSDACVVGRGGTYSDVEEGHYFVIRQGEFYTGALVAVSSVVMVA